MSKVRLRLNSQGWFWLWMVIHGDGWPPIREVWVGPASTAADAYEGAKRGRYLYSSLGGSHGV